jgi:hypothetical protein
MGNDGERSWDISFDDDPDPAFRWVMFRTSRTGKDPVSYTGYERVTTGRWYHVVAVLEPGGFRRLYLDGHLVAEEVAQVETALYDSVVDLNLGRKPTGAGYFAGRLDEVRLSSVARSSAWIQATFRIQSSPGTFLQVGPVEPWLGWWDEPARQRQPLPRRLRLRSRGRCRGARDPLGAREPAAPRVNAHAHEGGSVEDDPAGAGRGPVTSPSRRVAAGEARAAGRVSRAHLPTHRAEGARLAGAVLAPEGHLTPQAGAAVRPAGASPTLRLAEGRSLAHAAGADVRAALAARGTWSLVGGAGATARASIRSGGASIHGRHLAGLGLLGSGEARDPRAARYAGAGPARRADRSAGRLLAGEEASRARQAECSSAALARELARLSLRDAARLLTGVAARALEGPSTEAARHARGVQPADGPAAIAAVLRRVDVEGAPIRQLGLAADIADTVAGLSRVTAAGRTHDGAVGVVATTAALAVARAEVARQLAAIQRLAHPGAVAEIHTGA